MKLLAQIGRIAGLILLGPAMSGRISELAAIDTWIDDDQWLAGLPHDSSVPVGWCWWRGQ
jgi:hypothetical protein